MAKQHSDYAWEYYFNEEALKVEELLSSGAAIDYGKSRLRMALERNILSWSSYKVWFQNHFDTPVLNDHLGPSDIISLCETFNKNKVFFINTLDLSADQIAFQMWDDKIIILGLSLSEKIRQIPNSIFILCSPQIINLISDPHSSQSEINAAWTKIDSQHFDLCLEARKNFDAFIVLKIKNNQTELFKLDDDLSREKLDENIFKYSLKTANPFTNAIKLNQSQSFDLSELNMKILDYVSGTITSLKKGQNTVGFLLGLKTTAVNADDNLTLESISLRVS